MTPRQRLLTTIARQHLPDHVPVAPDTSNMIPCRLTGKPFWDIYLWKDIPQWMAYIDCAKYFGFDALMDGYAQVRFEDMDPGFFEQNEYIVGQDEDKIITRTAREANGKLFWSDAACVYYRDNPPTGGVALSKLNLPQEPGHYEKVIPRNTWPEGEALIKFAREYMGDQGLVGVGCGGTVVLSREDDIYAYYDDPDSFRDAVDSRIEYFTKRFHRLMSLEHKPDFLCLGGSGTLVYQTEAIFRELGLPILKAISKLCKEHGIPSHVHSCGPETKLVEIAYNETDLTIIDPLEIPPMGDCILADLKAKYGDKLILKGNLHTTDVMFKGTVDDVVAAAKKAIDDAAEGGGFILSTGDQCGRDTPDENLFAMIETAKTYGRYS